MADSIVRLRVDSQEYDNKLKRAAEGLNRYIEGCRKAGGTLEHVDDGVKEFTQQLGKMETVAGGAKGKLGEMTKAFTDLTMQFNQMTEAEKRGQFGKALSSGLDELKQRIISTKQELAEINSSLNNVGGSGGGGLFGGDKLSGMLQVFGGNVMTKLAGAGMGFVTEMGDMVKQGIELARAGEGIRIAFERLGRGDLLDGLRQATHGTVTDLELMKAAVKFNDFKLPLDELGTMLAFAQQKAKDTGQSVDYMVDSIVTGLGRKSLMILDNLGLSASEIKDKMAETGDMTKAVGAIIREQMAKAGDYVETAADRATKANVEVQNAMTRLGETFQPLTDAGTSMFNNLKVGALDFINKALRPMIDMLTEAGRMRKLYNAQKDTNDAKIQEMLAGLSSSELPQHQHRVNLAYWDKNINKYQQYLTDYKTWQKDNTSVGAHDRMVSFQKETGLSFFSDVKEQLEVFKRQKADYVKLSKDLLTKKVEDNKVEEQSIDSLKKKLQELQAERKKAIAAGDTDLSKNLLKQINQTKNDIKGLSGGTTTTTKQTPQQRAQESFTKAEQNYKQALEQAAMELEAGTITRAEAKKKEMQAAEQRWKAIGDARNISDSPELKQAQDEAAANYKALAAEVKQMDDAIKAAKIKWEKGESGFNAETMNAWMKGRQGDLQKTDFGSTEYGDITANIADMNTIKTIVEQRMKAGMEAADTDGIMEQLWERVFDGENIPDETWQNLVDEINKKLKELGLDTIKIDFGTGETSKKGRGREKKNPYIQTDEKGNEKASLAGVMGGMATGMSEMVSGMENLGIEIPKGFKDTISAVQGVTSILNSIVVIVQAIEAISAIDSIIPFAHGGVVKAANGYVSGNTYSGDQIPAMLNAGEVVLNRSQQGVLAASLQAVGQSGEGGGGGKPYVSGEMIWLGLNNYLNRSGRGEIVTSKRR